MTLLRKYPRIVEVHILVNIQITTTRTFLEATIGKELDTKLIIKYEAEFMK